MVPKCTPFVAFFFAGSSNVIVTMPSAQETCTVCMWGDDTDGMGLNPHRKQVRRQSDYLFVGLAVLACVALLAWAFLG